MLNDTTAQPMITTASETTITPATLSRHWREFAQAFERADDLDDRTLNKAWHSFSDYMERITKAAQLEAQS